MATNDSFDTGEILYEPEGKASREAAGGQGVITGFAVTQRSPIVNMSVDVSAGKGVGGAGTFESEAALTNIVIPNGDPTNPRIDLIVYDVSADIPIRIAGTPSPAPNPPDRSDTDDIILARVHVDANESTWILDSDIYDCRAFVIGSQDVFLRNNVNFYNGANLSIYSDDGSTLKAKIFGATGNTTLNALTLNGDVINDSGAAWISSDGSQNTTLAGALEITGDLTIDKTTPGINLDSDSTSDDCYLRSYASGALKNHIWCDNASLQWNMRALLNFTDTSDVYKCSAGYSSGTPGARLYAATSNWIDFVPNAGAGTTLVFNGTALYPGSNKGLDIGSAASRFNNAWHAAETVGTSRLTESLFVCPECNKRCIKGTGGTTFAGQDYDYHIVWCPECSKIYTEKVDYTTNEEKFTEPMPDRIVLKDVKYVQHGSYGYAIEISYRYYVGDVIDDNATILGTKEMEDWKTMTTEERDQLVYELAIIEWRSTVRNRRLERKLKDLNKTLKDRHDEVIYDRRIKTHPDEPWYNKISKKQIHKRKIERAWEIKNKLPAGLSKYKHEIMDKVKLDNWAIIRRKSRNSKMTNVDQTLIQQIVD